VLDLEYTEERTQSAAEKRRIVTEMLYAAAHPVSKRNMMYVLRPELPGLTATWVPGIPQPKEGCADEFLKVRLGGIPAGARKLYVTVEACSRVASSGLLCAMPGIGAIKKMKSVLRKVEAAGVAAHVGASYYLRHTDGVPYTADQNRDEFRTTMVCAGTYMKIVAPRSTLAQSPAFNGAVDEARGEFGNWVTECQTYEAAMQEQLATGISTVIGKYVAGIESLAELEAIQSEFDQVHEDDVLTKKAVARRLIRRACAISKQILEEADEDEEQMEGEEPASDGEVSQDEGDQ